MVIAVGAVLTAAEDRARADRAVDVASRRYDEWLGPAPAATGAPAAARTAWWPSPASMDLESQIAFDLARGRLAPLGETGALIDGLAWRLQAHVVEELFDYAQHQPGHHADEVALFGNHVRWGVPLLVLPKDARDRRAPAAIAHAAEVVGTLEAVVGFPALAAAVRSVIANPGARGDLSGTKSAFESALAVPLDWFFAALDPAFSVNYSLSSVTTRPHTCDGQPCQETTIEVRRDGQALFRDGDLPSSNGLAIEIDFGGAQRSTLWWKGNDDSRRFTFHSASAPIAVTLDPERRVRVDTNALDQRWQAAPGNHARPTKLIAAWMIWLQNVALSYGVLL